MSVASGPMSSTFAGYRRSVRLNASLVWNDQVVAAVRTVGALARARATG